MILCKKCNANEALLIEYHPSLQDNSLHLWHHPETPQLIIIGSYYKFLAPPAHSNTH
jgi:hypothetical protein